MRDIWQPLAFADIRTIWLVTGVSCLVYGFLQSTVGIGGRRERAQRIWGFGYLAGGLAAGVYSLGAPLPGDSHLALANGLNAIFWVLLWVGMRSFSRRPIPRLLVLVAPVLAGALLLFPLTHSVVGAVTLLTAAGFLVLTIVDGVRDQRTEHLRKRTVVLGICGAWLVPVVYGLLVTFAGGDLGVAANVSLSVWALSFFALVTALGVSLILMVNERLEMRLTRLARTDSLTETLNRFGLFELGERLVQRAGRDRRPVSVLMLDLDAFKQVNDVHGHSIGDDLLRAFVDATRVLLRPRDLLARYGGEEFCVLLPDTDRRGALAVAERVRAAVEAMRVETCTDGIHASCTVSIGVVEIHTPEEGIGSAIVRADRALYRAKQEGRNRVRVA